MAVGLYKYSQRRVAVDRLIMMTNVLGGCGWVLLLIAFLLLASGQPASRTAFGYRLPANARDFWDMNLAHAALFSLFLALACGGTALFINRKRKRRKTDFYRVSPVIVMLLAILGIAAWFKFFYY